MGISQFFIERPVFAWVIAIVIALAGVLAIRILPITQYPTIAPPAVTYVTGRPALPAATCVTAMPRPLAASVTASA